MSRKNNIKVKIEKSKDQELIQSDSNPCQQGKEATARSDANKQIRYDKRCQQLFFKQVVTQNLSVTEYILQYINM